MSYRVETASSNRAGCQATECKNAGIKIDKDDLRLGTWVEFQDRGSWMWRHWGCVTGRILEGLRTYLADEGKPGTYRWDALDGYEGGEKNSLDKHSDLQAKVRRCITQGFIDHEDFNGDPEMNVLGASGLRTKDNMKKIREDKKNRTHEIDELRAQLAAVTAERDELKANGAATTKLQGKLDAIQKDIDEHVAGGTPASKKRVRAEDADEEATPAKKKRVYKKKVKNEEGDEQAIERPKRKPRAKKVKDEDEDEKMKDDEEDVKPAKPARKPRAKKVAVKKEDDEEAELSNAADDIKPAPAKKSRAKKAAVKKEEDTDMIGLADDTSAATAPKKRIPHKSAVKAEPVDEEAGIDTENKVKPAAKRGKKAAKEGPVLEPALADSSNPGVTEGSSQLSEVPELLEPELNGEEGEGVDVAEGGDTGDVPSSEAQDRVADAEKLGPPAPLRRTRSRTSSN